MSNNRGAVSMQGTVRENQTLLEKWKKFNMLVYVIWNWAVQEIKLMK